ncbi:hypothetical protein DFH09DRAFT_1339606 [Mycena vulgaris]|nr:hypothetical protein DFH09DRAFT_1339606 [Mycena vulgaris]
MEYSDLPPAQLTDEYRDGPSATYPSASPNNSGLLLPTASSPRATTPTPGAQAAAAGRSRGRSASSRYNHSGNLGEINFFNGVMGYANAQRMLDYIRVIVEFISQLQSQYKDLIPLIGIVNEGACLLHARARKHAAGPRL